MKRSDLKSAKMRDREGIIHVRKLTRKSKALPGHEDKQLCSYLDSLQKPRPEDTGQQTQTRWQGDQVPCPADCCDPWVAEYFMLNATFTRYLIPLLNSAFSKLRAKQLSRATQEEKYDSLRGITSMRCGCLRDARHVVESVSWEAFDPQISRGTFWLMDGRIIVPKQKHDCSRSVSSHCLYSKDTILIGKCLP